MKRLLCVVFALALAGAAAAGEWHIETVDTEGIAGYFTSIQLDSSDYPRIAYYDLHNRKLKYARWDGDSWQIRTVDSGCSPGGSPWRLTLPITHTSRISPGIRTMI